MKRILVKWFYRSFQEQIRKHQKMISETESWKDNCELLITINGKNYYKFIGLDFMPLNRYLLITDWMVQDSKKLTKDEEAKLLDGWLQLHEKQINALNFEKRLKFTVDMGWVAKELQDRHKHLLFHPEILLELVAYTIIREDENPAEINRQIHEEKKKLFSTEGGDIPFYLQAGLGQYYPNWQKSTKLSRQLVEANQEVINRTNSIYNSIFGETQSIETA